MRNYFKKIALITIAVMPLIAAAQDVSYYLTGKIGHLSGPAKVYLLYPDSSGRLQTEGIA